MEVVDYALSGVLLLAFVVGTVIKRKSWFLVESVVCGVVGAAMFIMPRQTLSYLTNFKDNDISSIYRMQMVASQLVSAAYITYNLRKSSDKSMVQCLTVSKMLIGVSLLFTMYKEGKDHPEAFRPGHLTFGTFGVLLWFLGNLVEFLGADLFGSGHWIMNDRLSKQMLFDFFMSTTVCFPNLMWPEYMLKTTSGMSFPVTDLGIYWCHVIGCFMLGIAIQLYAAIGFSIADKRTYTIGRVISFVFYVASLLYWTGTPNMTFSIGLFLLLANLLYALASPLDEKQE